MKVKPSIVQGIYIILIVSIATIVGGICKPPADTLKPVNKKDTLKFK